MATIRTGFLGSDSTTNPGYSTDSAAGSSVAAGTDLDAALAKSQAGILTGTVTSDEYKALVTAAQTITLVNGGKPPADLGKQALDLAYSQGNISDDAYLLIAPLGTSLPAQSDAVVFGPWETLGSQIGAVAVANAGSISQSAIVALGTRDFAIPKKKGISICVEYRLNRATDLAITPVATAGTKVVFEADWSVVACAAVADNKYKITVGGRAYQESQAVAAAIPVNTFQYRYVLKVTNPTSPAVPSTYSV